MAACLYLGALTSWSKSHVLPLAGRLTVQTGDRFDEWLLNGNSSAFTLKSNRYESMLRSALQLGGIEHALLTAEIYGFRPSLMVFFRLYLDRRKLLSDYERRLSTDANRNRIGLDTLQPRRETQSEPDWLAGLVWNRLRYGLTQLNQHSVDGLIVNVNSLLISPNLAHPPLQLKQVPADSHERLFGARVDGEWDRLNGLSSASSNADLSLSPSNVLHAPHQPPPSNRLEGPVFRTSTGVRPPYLESVMVPSKNNHSVSKHLVETEQTTSAANNESDLNAKLSIQTDKPWFTYITRAPNLSNNVTTTYSMSFGSKNQSTTTTSIEFTSTSTVTPTTDQLSTFRSLPNTPAPNRRQYRRPHSTSVSLQQSFRSSSTVPANRTASIIGNSQTSSTTPIPRLHHGSSSMVTTKPKDAVINHHHYHNVHHHTRRPPNRPTRPSLETEPSALASAKHPVVVTNRHSSSASSTLSPTTTTMASAKATKSDQSPQRLSINQPIDRPTVRPAQRTKNVTTSSSTSTESKLSITSSATTSVLSSNVNKSSEHQTLFTSAPLPANHKPPPGTAVHISSMDFGQWRPVSPFNHKSELFSMFSPKPPIQGASSLATTTASSIGPPTVHYKNPHPINQPSPNTGPPPLSLQSSPHRVQPPPMMNKPTQNVHQANAFSNTMHGSGPSMHSFNQNSHHSLNKPTAILNSAAPNRSPPRMPMNWPPPHFQHSTEEIDAALPLMYGDSHSLFGQPNQFMRREQVDEPSIASVTTEETVSTLSNRESRTFLKDDIKVTTGTPIRFMKRIGILNDDQNDRQWLTGISKTPTDLLTVSPISSTSTMSTKSPTNMTPAALATLNVAHENRTSTINLFSMPDFDSIRLATAYDLGSGSLNEIALDHSINASLLSGAFDLDAFMTPTIETSSSGPEKDKVSPSVTTESAVAYEMTPTASVRLQHDSNHETTTSSSVKLTPPSQSQTYSNYSYVPIPLRPTQWFASSHHSSTASPQSIDRPNGNNQLSQPQANGFPATTSSSAPLVCPPAFFRCANGHQCVPQSSVCDHQPNCADKSDEFGCSCADYLKRFNQRRKLCDAVLDCADYSDEIDCDYCQLNQTESGDSNKASRDQVFVCAGTRSCVHRSQVCDGNFDCPNGADEDFCVSLAEPAAISNNQLNQIGAYRTSFKLYHKQGVLVVRRNGLWLPLCLPSTDEPPPNLSRNSGTDTIAYARSVHGSLHSGSSANRWTQDEHSYDWQLDELGRAVCSIQSYQELQQVRIEKLNSIATQQFFTMEQPTGMLRTSTKWRNLFKYDACPSGKVAQITCKDFGEYFEIHDVPLRSTISIDD